jgi:hypothetical protein
VTYTAFGTRDPFDLGSIRRLEWGEQKDRWVASFTFPTGWKASEHWKGSEPKILLNVTAPDSQQQQTPLKFNQVSYAFEEVNAEFVGDVDWQKPEFSGPGLRDLHYGERTELGTWVLWRVIWRVGGLSGDPPMHFLMVVQDKGTGRWLVQMAHFQYPPSPDGSNAMNAVVDDDQSLTVSWWNYHGRNTAVVDGWRFKTTSQGDIRREALKPKYSLYTRTGRVASFADTPEVARHLGYQEVAWALRSWDSNGGIAEAFAPSPRRFLSEEDRHGAPILPTIGQHHFQWAAELYILPWARKPKRLPLAQALQLLKQGRWDVVIFPRWGQGLLAMRLVEHHRDFPHSTPRP